MSTTTGSTTCPMSNLEKHYEDRLQELRTQLIAKIPSFSTKDNDNGAAALAFVDKCNGNNGDSSSLDDQLAEFVVLAEATPRGLADFVVHQQQQHGQQEQQKQAAAALLLEQLLSDKELLKTMLLADGAAVKKQQGKNKNNNNLCGGEAQYGPAMKIYMEIQEKSKHANKVGGGVLSRLALAISLEHAVPIPQCNAQKKSPSAKNFVDPVQRYLNYEAAYLGGELDPDFCQLSVWELRMVVNGDEPDETAAWGRSTLRNFRPDHILLNGGHEWRYVGLVRSDVRYGSKDVQFDRPELQKYQNILMNGGVCGRRAFIGRFILRSFGIPTEARPSSGHGALCHWTPDKGWIVNLGGGWGCGWTRTIYGKDMGFLATTQARQDMQAYWKVKRAQWIGDVMGERRVYSEQDGGGGGVQPVGFWYGLSLQIQKAIINESKNKALAKPPKEPVMVKPTMRERVLNTAPAPDAKKIVYNKDDGGSIVIPAAAFLNPKQTKDVHVMTSFLGGFQIYLPSFSPQGKTMMRGGTWKNDANVCCSGHRLLSDGFGRYHNWGFRACVSPPTIDDNNNNNDEGTCSNNSEILKLDLGSGVTMELMYIKPGTFVMGGENAEDGRFKCVDVPKHKVELTRGYYLGKYPVTQAQYESIMGKNPSQSTKDPNCPVDNISEEDAMQFCTKLGEISGLDVRLPTDAEWEHASRAGRDTKWFFGDDPSQLGEYAWFSGNAGGKSHPVGQKKPNPWGLFDIYGNVCERVADKYASNYYATSPTIDPTGPNQGTKSRFEYSVNVTRSGKYSIVANVVTVNYNQRLNVSVKNHKGDSEEAAMEMPFTLGQWQDSTPVMLNLEEGDNMLSFWRDKPPQYGLVIKDFIIQPSDMS